MHPKRILIVGNGGAGKTSLALKVAQHYQFPLLHLDGIYWSKNWQHAANFEFELKKFIQLSEFIIEGTPMKGIEMAISHIDTVIFLDMSRLRCVFRLLKRDILNLFKLQKSLKGPAKFLSYKAYKWVWNFNKNYRDQVQILFQQSEAKYKFRLSSPVELKAWIKSMPF